VSLDEEWRADIRIRRSLVFLEPPAAGDLLDTYALPTGKPTSAVLYRSPSVIEVAREEREPGRLTVSWLPRDPITLYAIHEHENGWKPAATFDGPAVCAEYECDMRTGMFTIECVAPASFEAAVLFRRPRWPKRFNERQIVRTALQRLKLPVSSPQITDGGMRVASVVHGPRVGERYLLVAFRTCGVADCEAWLRQTSLIGRMQRAAAGWVRLIAPGY